MNRPYRYLRRMTWSPRLMNYAPVALRFFSIMRARVLNQKNKRAWHNYIEKVRSPDSNVQDMLSSI